MRTCTIEPDVIRPDGTAGSYTLQARLMRRVYELVDFVDTNTKRALKSQKDVPMQPLVRTATNTAVRDTIRCLPDVMLGFVKDEEVLLVCKNGRLAFVSFSAFFQCFQRWCVWQDMLSSWIT